jgi:hypothetical protein
MVVMVVMAHPVMMVMIRRNFHVGVRSDTMPYPHRVGRLDLAQRRESVRNGLEQLGIRLGA